MGLLSLCRYYHEAGQQGGILGGTALLDPSVREHNYPQSVIATVTYKSLLTNSYQEEDGKVPVM
jgi:hypothetical protein